MDASLKLLGQFSVAAYDGPIPIDNQSARVLAALAVNGPSDRRSLAELLWPNACDERGLANLRGVLWRAPDRTGQLIKSTCRELCLHPAVDVDIHALCLGNRPDDITPDVVGFGFTLEQLSAQLLTGWYDEWVIAERDRVRRCQLNLLEHRIKAHLGDGNTSRAVIEATWAVTVDPLNESVHQLLLKAHLAEGNVYEAVAHYRYLTKLLDRELGVPPFPETWKIIEPCLW